MSRPFTDEPLDTLVFRPLAARLVHFLAPTPVTANQVSVAGAVAGAFAAACLLHGGPTSAIGVPVFLFVSLVLDVADGQLARARAQRSHAGWVMDILADGSKGVVVFTALAIALGRAYGPPGLFWGVAAGLSVLVQVLGRDSSLHRFERETDPHPELETARLVRIDDERRRLRAGPLTLARVAMTIHDVAQGIAAQLGARPRPIVEEVTDGMLTEASAARLRRAERGGSGGGRAAARATPEGDTRRLAEDESQRRIAAQALFRHLGGTAQLVTVAIGAATGTLLPAAAVLVAIGNAVLVAAMLLEWRSDVLQVVADRARITRRR